MQWNASVLSTVSSDTDPSIIIGFDDAKYIFNTPEATKRACLQSRRTWRKTRALFMSQVSGRSTGGLTGMLMSMADTELPQVDVIGPPGTTHLLGAMRMYTFRKKLAVYPTDVPSTSDISPSPNPVYKDDLVQIYSIPISPSITVSSKASEDPSLKRKRESSPDGPSKRPSKPSTLGEHLEDLSFCSTDLRGDLAQEWRQLMVKTMFPKSHKPRAVVKDREAKKQARWEERQAKKLKEEGNADGSAQSNLDDYERTRPHQSFFHQLPKFESVDHEVALAYIIIGPRVRGKFDAKRATELGVPFGPQRGQLTKGQSITISVKQGDTVIERVVKPEECVGPTENPSVVIILDVPTPGHIPSLVSSFTASPFYSRFLAVGAEEYNVRAVFHTCGEGVLEDGRYIEFMNSFSSTVHHIVASRTYSPNPVTFTSYARTLSRMNTLDAQMYPVPKFSLASSKSLLDLPNLPPSTQLMKANLVLGIRPVAAPQIEMNAEDLFHPALNDNNNNGIAGTALKVFEEAQKKVKEMEGKRERRPGDDVEIITLGTGSAVSTKYRNVLSILVRIPNYGSILMDTGEGTWGQLVRQFGEEEVLNVLRDIKVLFVSHVHGDHHMGLAKILARRAQLNPPPERPLYLVTIRAIHLYLRELSDIMDLGLSEEGNGVRTVMSEALHWRTKDAYPTMGRWTVGGDEPWTDIQRSRDTCKEVCSSLGLETFRTVDVWHRTRCFGLHIKHRDGWSLVFSADTQPADPLVYAGQGATLLIHEASMADDQADLAEEKAHSTIGQAIEIGRRMNAENILLTHFSARYPRMPRMGESEAALAFDHACMRIGDMWKVPIYLPAIEKCFKDTEEADEDEEGLDASAAVEVDVI